MGELLDHTTLKWIKNEIQESLKQTQQALESYAEDTSDSTQIRFCATYLHQVYGTLQMVEVYGAALLAEEMEKVANALLNDKVVQKDDAFDVLMTAIIQLPSYLENLEHGQPDMPIVLTPLLNDLRAARGKPLLSENAFFSPDLTVMPPEKPLTPGKHHPDTQTYARKLRPIFQVSLLHWFRGADTTGSLKKLAAVLRELQNASNTDTAQRLWWVAGGVIEALIEGGLETSGSVKLLMGQIDREIKRLIDHGENNLLDNPPTELLKNCLYYTGTAHSAGPRVSAVKQAFDLDRLIPYGGALDQAIDDLKGSTADILENVSAVIKEDLLQVKDQLDIFVRSPDRNVTELTPLGENLSRTADTLAMLSLGDLRKVIQDQASHIEQLVATGNTPNDNALMEIASALLYVEASLENIEASRRGHRDDDAPDLTITEDDTGVVLLPPGEQTQITNLVIKEIRSVLADIKEGFNTFAIEPGQFGPIVEAPEKLTQIQGALSLMNLEHAAKLLGATIAFIRDDILATQQTPSTDQLNALADAITSIEYYLEAIEEGRGQPENVLAVAKVSVEQLGYAINDQTTTSAATESTGAPTPTSKTKTPVLVKPETEIKASKTPIPAAQIHSNEDYPEEDIDEEILEIFIEEADEVLDTITDCLHAWRADNDDRKSVETLRRSYHTIKGSGRLAGAVVMGELAWALENLLNRVLDNKTDSSPTMFSVLEDAEIALRDLLGQLKGERDTRPPLEVLTSHINALIEGTELNLADVSTLSEDQDIIAEEATETKFPTAEAALIAATETLQIDAENQLENAENATTTPTFDPVLAEVFRKETLSHLGTLREFLNTFGKQDSAPINDNLQRALHTLHGSARMANVHTIAELSEAMDRTIRVLHGHGLPLDADGLNLLTDFVHHTETLVGIFNKPEAEAEAIDYTSLLARIDALHEQLITLPTEPITPKPVAEPSFEDDELTGVFVEEAGDILHNADALMQHWRAAPGNIDLLAELQRTLHTLKGGARLASIHTISNFAHELGSLLEATVEGNQTPGDTLPSLLQDGLDWLGAAVEQARTGAIIEPIDELLTRIQQYQPDPATLIAETDHATTPEVDESPLDTATPTPIDYAESFGQQATEMTEEIKSEAPPHKAEEDFAEPLVDTHTELTSEAATSEDTEEAFEELEAISAASDFEAETKSDTPPSTPTTDYDPELLEIFLEEAEELLENAERILHAWSQECENLAHIAELQRILHTLKGGARMANVTVLGDLAHAMESLLERITEGRLQVEPDHPALLQSCHDWLTQTLEAAQKLQIVEAPAELSAQIEAAIRGERFGPTESAKLREPASPIVETTVSAKAKPNRPADGIPEETEELENTVNFSTHFDTHPEAEFDTTQKAIAVGADEQIRVRAELLNELVNFSSEINIYNARIAQQLGAWHFNLTELDQTVTRLREQLRKFEIETEAQILYRHETTSGETDDFDPLELDRFSTMHQLSRGMVESLGDFVSIQSLLENLSSETDVLLLQQRRVASELQEGLLHTRMVAFSTVLPRLRRILRQTCKETGKQAELIASGGEGELDRTQLNRLVSALEHILRNAIDHGLELPAERKKLGKPATGEIHIRFTHEGSQIVLTISDDGAGLNIDALREKAIETGRMLPDAALSDSEIYEFVLESGFSTAEKVTQISGRGVGMDVVNTEIKQLGGSLHIESRVGKGSTFTLHLPLTVLVNQALMVEAGESTYAIQLPNVEHVVRVGRNELEPMASGGHAFFEYASHHYQYLNLGTVLHGTPSQLPSGKQHVPLMLVRSGEHRVALHVDNLLGRQEIVIKSVGPQLSAVGALSGATILPDGTVALILNVGNLVRSALAQQHGKEAPLLASTNDTGAEKGHSTTIMVVDDSITVRKVTERLLKRHDYAVITAKDGVDALTVLLETLPDIMLLDVEMPRMDGYELATTMHNDERLRKIPIIMITSRTGNKHRQRALDIGVNMYMGKPYQEQELIENIRTLARTERN
jgi:chemosensory pili system protein ChpA (sensor histidine kinase/response regulator)